MKKIIAIVGMCGSGKTVAINYMKNRYSFETIYFGGVVLDNMRLNNIEINTDNERIMREDLREKHGMAAIAILSASSIDTKLKDNNVIAVDGLYSYSEYLFLKEKFGTVILIAIHANKNVRIERLCERKLRPLTIDEIFKRDHLEIINLEKGGPIAIADFHIVNNGNENRLFEKIDVVIKQILFVNDEF